MKKTLLTSIMGAAMSVAAFAAAPPAPVDTAFTKFRAGGYGEMLAQFKDYGLNRFSGVPTGNMKVNHNEISIPRFVLAGDYKITKKWILGAEIEFESGGTGQAMEIEKGSGAENRKTVYLFTCPRESQREESLTYNTKKLLFLHPE